MMACEVAERDDGSRVLCVCITPCSSLYTYLDDALLRTNLLFNYTLEIYEARKPITIL